MRFRSSAGNGEEEAGALLAVGGVDFNGAFEEGGYHAADVESEAGAFGGAGEFFEALEDNVFFAGRYADTGIGDCEGDGLVVIEGVGEGHGALVSEFCTVVEEVDEDLFYTGGIGEYVDVGFVGVGIGHGDAGFAVLAHGVDGDVADGVDRGGFLCYFGLRVFKLGNGEHVVDNGAEHVGRDVDHVGESFEVFAFGVLDVVDYDVATFHEHVERCAHFVAHIVDEFSFVAVGFSGVVAGSYEFFLHALEVVSLVDEE